MNDSEHITITKSGRKGPVNKKNEIVKRLYIENLNNNYQYYLYF